MKKENSISIGKIENQCNIKKSKSLKLYEFVNSSLLRTTCRCAAVLGFSPGSALFGAPCNSGGNMAPRNMLSSISGGI